MKKLLFTLCCILLLAARLDAQEASPRVAEERIILRTNMGDMVLALYPDVAPRHVEQITKLARMGVYDGVSIYRIEPSFVVQLADARHGRSPLLPEQLAGLGPIKAEFSALKHRRGTLSMARYDDRPDSAETSFSILLADAPHLDGKYTVFGHVERGGDVLEAISRVETDARHQPRTPVRIEKAQVVDSPEELSQVALRGPIVRERRAETVAVSFEPLAFPAWSLWLCGGAAACGLLMFFAAGRALPCAFGTVGQLMAFVSVFVMFVALVPRAGSSPSLAVACFAGTVTLFKLMNRFESKR